MKLVIKYIILLLVITSCSEYQKILKNTDFVFKYEKGKEYLEQEEYTKAVTLLSEVVPLFKGSEKAEESLFLLSTAYLGQKNYLMGGHYFQQYYKTYPRGEFAEQAYFNRAYCYYLDSPKARLDQTTTTRGIEAFQVFLELFPNSDMYEEANGYINDLTDKLVEKSYINAKLYFDLGNYMGNNFQSAIIAAENSLKEYPETKYREELAFLILESRFVMAENSIITKQADRYRATIDEYYSFVNDYPESKFKRDADRIYKESQKIVGIN